MITVVVVVNAIVYFLALIGGDSANMTNLMLIPQNVLHGEIWRLITFIFIPPTTSPLWIIFNLFFFYYAGKGLEQAWGGFKVNVLYITGMILTIIASFITGWPAWSDGLQLMVIIAFALSYPDVEILFWGIIPLKLKYLAVLELVFLVVELIRVPFIGYIIIEIAPLIAIPIFFGKMLMTNIKYAKKKNDRRKSNLKVIKGYTHKCTVCGLTDIQDPDMDFRYCSKCEGKHCYCSNHIMNHQHITTKEKLK
nr:rhomboid family intramembrane serine protease [Clostridium bornimense]